MIRVILDAIEISQLSVLEQKPILCKLILVKQLQKTCKESAIQEEQRNK